MCRLQCSYILLLNFKLDKWNECCLKKIKVAKFSQQPYEKFHGFSFEGKSRAAHTCVTPAHAIGSFTMCCILDQNSAKVSGLKYLMSQQCCDSENESSNTRVKNTVTIV